MPRRLDGAAQLAAQVDWLRAAIRDPNLNTRMVLAGILDALEGAIRLLPAPPPSPKPPTGPAP